MAVGADHDNFGGRRGRGPGLSPDLPRPHRHRAGPPPPPPPPSRRAYQSSPPGRGSSSSSVPTAAEVARDVVVIFLSGVAILVCVVVIVYALAALFDRACRRCRCCLIAGFRALHTDGPRYVPGGEVARDAGLGGMTGGERRAVLEAMFPGEPYRRRGEDRIPPPGAVGVVGGGGGDGEASRFPNPGRPQSSGTIAPEAAREGRRTWTRTPPGSRVGPTAASTHGAGGTTAAEAWGSEPEPPPPPPAAAAAAASEGDAATCAICITEYEEGDLVIVGPCSHAFHRSCLLEWLQKRDVCPYCRENMMTSAAMREAAVGLLGAERMSELAGGIRRSADARASPAPDLEASGGAGPASDGIATDAGPGGGS